MKPRSIPDSLCELEDLSEVPGATHVDLHVPHASHPSLESNIIAPCQNMSTFRLQHWHWNEGSKKSIGSREALIRNVISQPDFVPADVSNIDWHRLDDSLAKYCTDPAPSKPVSSIPLHIPPRTSLAAESYKSNPSLCTFTVPIVQCVSLLGAIQLAFTKNNSRLFHYEPYEAYCRDPKTSETHRVYGEAYESQRMLDMHRDIQDIVLDTPCDLPRCVAATMLFSDGTLLANFGNAKAWPIKVTFGNLSKYERCKPKSSNHYELAFMPSLPNDIVDKIRKLEGGQKISKSLLTYLRRELFHELWKFLLNDEFLRAWRQGVVIRCADGITRRVFARIFSYSADYMEKILLALIRGMGSLHPCTRCLMPKSEFVNMGLPSDVRRRQELKRVDTKERNDLVREARSIIYNEGRAITSKRVEQLLKPHSYVPTENAFSRRLRPLGFDIFQSLTVDFLHEVELGVWKSVFQHILRILESTDSRSLAIFNERFRLIPPFGDGTIRPFTEDVSNMSRPAARNYEDILQCIIPAIEGLLPSSIEGQVTTLLYVLAQWHGLAKLRRHTSVTINVLRCTTTRLGHELREFHRRTSELEVYETTREHTARQQRARKKAKPRAALTADSNAMDADPSSGEIGRRRKYFSLDTVKFHVVGDYPESIECFGTMDSFSTQTGELLHRSDKTRFTRTNGRDYLVQMNKIQRIEARLSNIQADLEKIEHNLPSQSKPHPTTASTLAHEDLQTTDAGRSPYQIAVSQKNPIVLPLWLASDPALKNFLPRLKSHLLARIRNERYEEETNYPAADLAQIHFQYD
ncbi:hypothetical protein RSOL_256740 [Rhizoctonia solani AG-3 Rhs1AP]|uniref:Uncharacterized protein n=2 Tax=Rhizoctonia solani AG-3 TaxID=1086053 RepID=A0A074RFZ9_9AGAM|nr:hypothetical protein RSOL_256740 [Rhizoctonia solani AG-3 Rhs1AP]KEP46066.1 hypothetical protein V565_220780 [Rhizoctonia solani 123E]